MPQARFFWQALALVLLVHGLALTLLVPGRGALQGAAAAAGLAHGAPMPLLEVRPVVFTAPDREASPSQQRAAAALAGEAQAAAHAPSENEGPRPPSAPRKASPPPTTTAPEAPAAQAAAESHSAAPTALGAAEAQSGAPAALAAAESHSGAPAALAVYLSRGELTAPARLLTDVQVQFPHDVEGVVELKVRVSLFVEPDGSVARVRLDTPGIHPAFARTIAEAFGSARFEPGRLGDEAVRSLVRLEVEFRAPSGKRA